MGSGRPRVQTAGSGPGGAGGRAKLTALSPRSRAWFSRVAANRSEPQPPGENLTEDNSCNGGLDSCTFSPSSVPVPRLTSSDRLLSSSLASTSEFLSADMWTHTSATPSPQSSAGSSPVLAECGWTSLCDSGGGSHIYPDGQPYLPGVPFWDRTRPDDRGHARTATARASIRQATFG